MPEGAAGKSDLYVGVDVGGTNLRAGVVDGTGRILGEARRPAMADQGLAAAVDRTIEAIEEAIANANYTPSQIRGIGMGVPGGHDSKQGVCLYSPNFVGSHNVPIAPVVQEATGLPTFMLNDAFVVLLGEHGFGAGKGYEQVVMITLGTGIGGAAVIDGQLRIGYTEGFAEVGHMIVDPNGPFCECGNRGCWEALAGRDAIIQRALTKIQQGRDSEVARQVDYKLGSVTPALIAYSADNGDALAQEVMAETAHYIGVGVTTLIQLYNPEVLIIGGGIAHAGGLLFYPIRRTVQARAHMVPASTCRIVPAQLGDDAGVVGGAVLASLRLAESPA